MKKCNLCGIEKDLSNFSGGIHKKNNKFYYRSYCKPCVVKKYHPEVKNPGAGKLKSKFCKIKKNCELCRKEFETTTNPKSTSKYCSRDCRYELMSRLSSLQNELGIGFTKSNGGYY